MNPGTRPRVAYAEMACTRLGVSFMRVRVQSMIPKKPAPDLIVSAFTRVHSPSQTGVNALMDALWVGAGFRKRSCSS